MGEKSTDEMLFDEWVDELMLRSAKYKTLDIPISNERYARVRTIGAMVQELLFKRHSGDKKFAEYRPEIRRLAKELVMITLFYLDQFPEDKLNRICGKFYF